MTTPCLLPNADGAALEACIVSDHFYPLAFEVNNALGKTFYVKRRFERPYSGSSLAIQHSLLVQAGNFQECDITTFVSIVESLSGNPYVIAFARYICSGSFKKKPQIGAAVEDFCKGVLQECLVGYSEVSLPIYLKLRTSITAIESCSTSSAFFAWDFRLVRSFYKASLRHRADAGFGSDNTLSLLNIEKVAYLNDLVGRVVSR